MTSYALLDVRTLVASFAPTWAEKAHQANPEKQTQVTLQIGSGSNSGGSVPHIAIFDVYGNRVTQYKGNANGHIKADSPFDQTLDNTQNGKQAADPEYITIVMQENDGICLAGVSVSSNNKLWGWIGDFGAYCGAQWYQSKSILPGTNTNVALKCVWLDADHSNGVIAKGLSLHVRDFTPDMGLLTQYSEDSDCLCKNSARMTFWPNMLPNEFQEYFRPPMEYKAEENLFQDPNKDFTGGGLKNPNQGKDRKTSAYPDGTKVNKRKTYGRRALQTRGVKNMFPETLTVSHLQGHSAKELCEDPMSLGPDFVSIQEGVYCDMAMAIHWPLCDPSKKKDCFDMDTQQLKTSQRRGELPAKKYTTTDVWH